MQVERKDTVCKSNKPVYTTRQNKRRTQHITAVQGIN